MLKTLLKTLLEAVRGTHIDYTTAPIGRAVIMLAVPMVLEMSMESIFAVADVFWVAHLGADAVATVGLTESFMTLIYTAAMGLSIGATALVARRRGDRHQHRPRHGGALSDVDPRARPRPSQPRSQASAARSRDDAIGAAAVGHGHLPDSHWQRQLHRPGPHHFALRQRRARRLHH